jgi:hypothetical protein
LGLTQLMGETLESARALFDQGWLRAVLFSRDLESWIDLAPDPPRRVVNGRIYSETVSAAYNVWRWVAAEQGLGPEEAPTAELTTAAGVAVDISTWDQLLVTLTTFVRAQAVALRSVIAPGDEAARRAFGRPALDLAGHAAYGFAELRRRRFADPAAVQAQYDRAVPATLHWLRDLDAAGGGDLAARWMAQVQTLGGELGLTLPVTAGPLTDG